MRVPPESTDLQGSCFQCSLIPAKREKFAGNLDNPAANTFEAMLMDRALPAITDGTRRLVSSGMR